MKMIRLIGMDEKMIDFEYFQGTLIAMSYRMLGSFVEAEDIVQEVALEWMQADRQKIENPKAWLMRVCTNKTIDSLKRAYKKREVYTGTWLPEVLPDSLITWEEGPERKETLKTSFLILLENLSPSERAIFILKNVFEYNFKEIAEFVGLTESNCRKIFQRSKQKINPLTNLDHNYNEKAFELLSIFFQSACLGSQESIKNILDVNSEFWSDGGGKVSAVRSIINEPQKIARFFANIFKTLEDLRYDFVMVNFSPGLVLSTLQTNHLWKVETIFSFEIQNGKISRIFAQRNPDKLQFVEKILAERNFYSE